MFMIFNSGIHIADVKYKNSDHDICELILRCECFFNVQGIIYQQKFCLQVRSHRHSSSSLRDMPPFLMLPQRRNTSLHSYFTLCNLGCVLTSYWQWYQIQKAKDLQARWKKLYWEVKENNVCTCTVKPVIYRH